MTTTTNYTAVTEVESTTAKIVEAFHGALATKHGPYHFDASFEATVLNGIIFITATHSVGSNMESLDNYVRTLVKHVADGAWVHINRVIHVESIGHCA